ncbi:MAG: hypothetical protein ABIO24_03530 [Saprospiraceae bacterium]
MRNTLTEKFQSKYLMGAVFACGLWLLAASPAHAYSDCYGPVSLVYVQNGQVYIDTPGMVGYTQGYTEAQNAKFQSMAMAAFLSGKRLGLRFAADGVNCSVRAARGDLFALILVN